MSRNKLYGLLLLACFAGYVYLFYHFFHTEDSTPSLCPIKNVTGYPCPSCGSTRAVLLLLKGEFVQSLWLNPFGIIVAIIMAVFPVWILADIALKKDAFFMAYKKAETIIRKPGLAVILILIVLLNWIWNLYKNL